MTGVQTCALPITLEGLRSAEGYIRSLLARKINLRNTPEIRFILDQSIAYGVSMSKKIEDINRADDARHIDDSENEADENEIE